MDEFSALLREVLNYRKGERSSTLSWNELQKGKTLGKRVVTYFDGQNPQKSPIDILKIEGEDFQAQNICLTLSPPQFNFSIEGLIIANTGKNIQQTSGETGNIQLLNGEFQLPESVAIIEWGIGGVSQTAEVDFSNGLCVNLTASFVRVSSKVTAMSDGGIGVPTPGLITLSGFVGPGIPKSNNAQRTFQLPKVESLGPQLSPLFPIPNFAKQAILSMAAADNTGTIVPWSGVLQFWNDTQGIGIPICEGKFTDEVRFPMIVPNGAFYFKVLNTTPLNPVEFTRGRVVFDLGI